MSRSIARHSARPIALCLSQGSARRLDTVVNCAGGCDITGVCLDDDGGVVGEAVPEAALKSLDLLVDRRNAIGHGNEVKILQLARVGPIKATKRSYTEYRGIIDGLVGTIDTVVAAKLAALLNIAPPW